MRAPRSTAWWTPTAPAERKGAPTMPFAVSENSTNVRNVKYEEIPVRVIAVAVAGWMLLLAMVPAWARDAVLGFGTFYALLVCALDESVQSLLATAWSRLRSARGKRPASRRAAT